MFLPAGGTDVDANDMPSIADPFPCKPREDSSSARDVEKAVIRA
jgi:hypothetical protein